ncbi:hypothetical protein BH09BAC2_BH09BAC2_23330 [soil metagenome]
MNTKLRTPTETMIQKLRHCSELQKQNLPCTEGELKGSLAGLYKRGYINTKTFIINGKNIVGLYVTEQGFEFLNKIEMRSHPNNQ